MKIEELLEKKIEFKTSNKPTHGILVAPKLSHVATGVTAIVYEHKKRPNTIIKTIQLVDENDVLFAFVRLCMNHPNNPFFPKIYAAKVYKNKDLSIEDQKSIYSLVDKTDIPPIPGRYVMIVVMEKLYRINTSTTRGIATTLLQQLDIIPSDYEHIPRNIHNIRDPLSITNKRFSDPIKRRHMKLNSTNKQFKEALRLLEPLFNYGEPDLHKDNIMLRKSHHGPEIVLMDPVIMG